MTVVSTSHKGASWLLEEPSRRRRSRRRSYRRAPPDGADGRGVRRKRSAAEDRPARDEGLGSRARPRAPCRRARAPRHQRSRGVRRPRSRQGVRARRLGTHRALGLVRRHLRRPGESLHHADRAVRHRGAEGRSTCRARRRRDDRRLRAERIRLRIRRARGAERVRQSRPTAAGSSTARRCGSPTAASPTSSSSSPRSTASSSPPSSSSARSASESGNEEHKMGLHGSSTTPILLQDVKVPAENLLGEIGKGHKVAFNTLNFGRFKLGAMCSGGCRAAIGEAAKYAKQRKQFGQPIADFGAIKHKLGEMTARTYALESLMYRTAGLDRRDRRRGRTARRRRDCLGARGIRGRSVDREGHGKRSARVRARRERADSRRQRVREGLPGRALLPRCAREPHLRGHQRNQPDADPGHADSARVEGRDWRSFRLPNACRTNCCRHRARRCRATKVSRPTCARWRRSRRSR